MDQSRTKPNNAVPGTGRADAPLSQFLRRAARHWEARGLFTALRGNARVIVISEGVCAIPHQWLHAYLPLYMVALGVRTTEIGALASTLAAVQLLSTLVGGYMADRFGRKRVLVIGDIICWGLPLFLYTVARDPWYFWLGTIINGFVYVVVPGFDCLFVEDVPPDRRPAVFGAMQVLMSAASLTAPLAGLMVSRLGIIPAGRIMAGSTMTVILATAIIRQLALRETTVGQAKITALSLSGRREWLREHLKVLRSITGSYPLRSFLAVRILNAFATTVWVTYSALFLTDAAGLGLPKAAVAILPFISALVTMAILLLATRLMEAKRSLNNLITGQILWLAAALCFVASPRGTVGFVAIWAVIHAISNALSWPVLQSYWAGIVGEWNRAPVFALGASLTSFCTLPAGLVAGAMYTLSPRAPFLLSAGLQAVSLALVLSLRQHSAPAPVTSLPESPDPDAYTHCCDLQRSQEDELPDRH